MQPCRNRPTEDVARSYRTHITSRDVLAELAAFRSAAERRQAAKQRIAACCRQLLEDPQRYAPGHLRTLGLLCGDADGLVSRLALLSGLAVYRDVLPGYRIRPPTEAELGMRVSREVQALRDHEAALLRGYQAYLRRLVAALQGTDGGGIGGNGGKGSKGKGGGGDSGVGGGLTHARVAARCMSSLLGALPHFNYAGDLLQVLVANMAHR